MRTEQTCWFEGAWLPAAPGRLGDADLVLVFGGGAALAERDIVRCVRAAYPRAEILGCTTAGEIADVRVRDDSVSVTAVKFANTQLATAVVELSGPTSSYATGERIASHLLRDDLVHVFVLSDGLNVNGSELVRGLTSQLPEGVAVTGGLSGDGDRFSRTAVLCGDDVASGRVAAVAFYGDALRVAYASLGGWDPFGPERVITRADGNVLCELDGQSALELYKEYLGEHAAGLPATGLLFPLAVRTAERVQPVVRTVLAVDEASQTMTFAGDMPEGGIARLMRANFHRLVEGAAGAARGSVEGLTSLRPELAVLISCVGRKMVLKQRIEEEVEAVREVVGDGAAMTGFYSYGEISPFTPRARCELHNQTMTVTAFAER